MASEVSILSGVGKGTMLIKLDEGERVVGALVAVRKSDGFSVETEKGRTVEVGFGEVLGSRGSRGEVLVKKDRFARVILPPPTLPSLVNN
jgi:DNA gyrase subunit A